MGNNLLSILSDPFRETFWYRFEEYKVPLVVKRFEKQNEGTIRRTESEAKSEAFCEAGSEPFRGTVWGTE